MNGKYVVVPLGGGMRCAWTQGVLASIETVLWGAERIFTFSAGVLTSVAAIAGQHTEARRIWVEENTRPEVFDIRRIVKGRPPADPEFLVREAAKSVNRAVLGTSAPALYVGLFDPAEGETVFERATPENFDELTIASCAYPAAAPVQYVNGRAYVDGGTQYRLPLPVIVEQFDVRKALVIENTVTDTCEAFSAFKRYVAFPRHPRGRQALLERPIKFKEALEQIRSDPSLDVLVVRPSRELVSHKFTRDPRLVAAAFDQGLVDGKMWRPRIESWAGKGTSP
jgi:predicted patatin/cPLA2 family phospholipase